MHVMLGGGETGKEPPIMSDGGKPHRAFLSGKLKKILFNPPSYRSRIKTNISYFINRHYMQNQIAKYKHQIASRYLPITQNEIETKILKSDLYSISTKFDGHFYGLNFDGEKAELINHAGNVITDLPILNEAFEKLNKSECDKAILVGELYVYKKGESSII